MEQVDQRFLVPYGERLLGKHPLVSFKSLNKVLLMRLEQGCVDLCSVPRHPSELTTDTQSHLHLLHDAIDKHAIDGRVPVG